VRTEAHVLLFIASFFGCVAAAYWLWSYETSGTAMLIGSSLLGILPGMYYLWWSYRMRPRPEDLEEATMEDGAGVIGTFPSSSIWPFVFGLAATLVALALVFGFWTAIVGFVLATTAVVGIILESRRGGYV
jgi:ABC-type maltose transport system permease subunit